MVATPEIRTSQGDVVFISSSTADMRLSMADVAAVYQIPTERLDVSQADVLFVSMSTQNIQVSQADIIAVVRGRVDDPSIRAWTFTLDGHDFYVIRLGNSETLVYDFLTEQWSVWGTGEETYWSVYTGVNWIGGNSFAKNFGSNIIVGSDANGAIFFLDPNKPNDDSAVTGREAAPFLRKVTGQVPVRGYDYYSAYEVQLLGSLNELNLDATNTVELFYSDDRGDNYVSAGTIETAEGEYEIRASWRSLGSFSSPGRLFRIEDDGALQRIDSLTLSTDLKAE